MREVRISQSLAETRNARDYQKGVNGVIKLALTHELSAHREIADESHLGQIERHFKDNITARLYEDVLDGTLKETEIGDFVVFIFNTVYLAVVGGADRVEEYPGMFTEFIKTKLEDEEDASSRLAEHERDQAVELAQMETFVTTQFRSIFESFLGRMNLSTLREKKVGEVAREEIVTLSGQSISWQQFLQTIFTMVTGRAVVELEAYYQSAFECAKFWYLTGERPRADFFDTLAEPQNQLVAVKALGNEAKIELGKRVLRNAGIYRPIDLYAQTVESFAGINTFLDFHSAQLMYRSFCGKAVSSGLTRGQILEIGKALGMELSEEELKAHGLNILAESGIKDQIDVELRRFSDVAKLDVSPFNSVSHFIEVMLGRLEPVEVTESEIEAMVVNLGIPNPNEETRQAEWQWLLSQHQINEPQGLLSRNRKKIGQLEMGRYRSFNQFYQFVVGEKNITKDGLRCLSKKVWGLDI